MRKERMLYIKELNSTDHIVVVSFIKSVDDSRMDLSPVMFSTTAVAACLYPIIRVCSNHIVSFRHLSTLSVATTDADVDVAVAMLHSLFSHSFLPLSLYYQLTLLLLSPSCRPLTLLFLLSV